MNNSLPLGFRAAGVHAGLKSSGALDLTLIENTGPRFDAAAVYTTNQVVAAPVIWSREVTKGRLVRAAVLNSGGANACTGPEGFLDTHRTAEKVGELLEISSGEVVVCSTGLIGERLPMEKIIDGVLVLSTVMKSDSLEDVARAIMTTDTVPKIAEVESDGVRTVGVAKGAGMLAPALATMLSVVMTDAILPEDAQEIFSRVCDRTFNRIDSDGCMSTNDTVLLMGSGASGVELGAEELERILMQICGSLAEQLIEDAEGSTKSVAITIEGAASEADAVEVARACARNNLLKCAIFGGDPNWGRVLAAVGTAPAQLEPLAIDVTLNGVQVAKNSAPFEDKNLVNFDARLVELIVNLNVGQFTATVRTNDLSHDYVHENSAYST
ncbi:MAG: bifunctional glutamate N-acetyltransferase/amino-acid acetyltransferase ArgJ [Candidatus Planktophila sp.]|jgi:glutamate N-acetyltransferase/amino-acid N-acetyltransferase|nr:bifunctional glutamate N-acetyltransferase/amino-acid acetyltransferase ArgJ [Candidatus Planktophila sp.]MBP7902942.1 bifunctional glutamate N-acetyltransferase/amino-acid acetyltransferase ArgJ [Candidatus Planktophila sp.]